MPIDILEAFENEPPPLDFIWPGFITGTVGALIAPGGTGKSFWALEAAMSVACGGKNNIDLINFTPSIGQVIYLAGEDPESTIKHRIHSIGKYIDPQARKIISKNLIIESILGYRANIMDDKILDNIISEGKNKRLIIFDTLNRFHNLDENSNSDMANLLKTLEYIAVSTGAAVLFLHHVNKISTREGQTNQQQAARGASALIDNARWCGYVAKMSELEAKNLENQGKKIENYYMYMKCGSSKINYTQHWEDRWYKRHEGGVLLPIDLLSTKPQTKGTTRERL